MRRLLAPRRIITEPVRQYFGYFRFYPSHFVNTIRKCMLLTLSRRNSKMSLSLFPRYIAKWCKIYNLFEIKDPIEQNKSSRLEIKRRIGLQLDCHLITVQLEIKVEFVCFRSSVNRDIYLKPKCVRDNGSVYLKHLQLHFLS